MTWFYSQASGSIRHNSEAVGHGYSGHGFGLNNPKLEAEADVGPIPQGQWHIDHWDDHHGEKGPQVAVLSPVGHDAHGRSGFLIHGDNAHLDHSASHGCIIASRDIRDKWRESNDNNLEVTS